MIEPRGYFCLHKLAARAIISFGQTWKDPLEIFIKT